MAYTSTNLTTLAHLKALAEKAEATYAKQTDLDGYALIANWAYQET